MASIKVSQLNEQTIISGEDFFPMVNSSSLITYESNLNSLISLFGIPEISMSWATTSLSSSYALRVSYPSYPQISSSWTSQSISSSYSLTASYAPFSSQIFQTTCSWVSKSISSSYTLTASWAPQPTFIPQNSCSYATSESFSASYALSASYAPNMSGGNGLLVLNYIKPIVIVQTKSKSFTASYQIPNDIPYSGGIILQAETQDKSPGDGNYGYYFVSSSATINPVIFGSVVHGNCVKTIFIPVLPQSRSIIISGLTGKKVSLAASGALSASLIGYY